MMKPEPTRAHRLSQLLATSLSVMAACAAGAAWGENSSPATGAPPAPLAVPVEPSPLPHPQPPVGPPAGTVGEKPMPGTSGSPGGFGNLLFKKKPSTLWKDKEAAAKHDHALEAKALREPKQEAMAKEESKPKHIMLTAKGMKAASAPQGAASTAVAK